MNQIDPSHSSPARVALVSAGWHKDIVGAATRSFAAEFERCRVPIAGLRQFEVPGAFEIPLHAQRLARSGQFDAIVAFAFVVNGGIYRHEFVASAVIDGLMRVQLDCDVPVFSAVLTPRDFHGHEEHSQFFREHFVLKGREAAQACLQTLSSLRSLPG
ncbi:6,7-dimethyl-8-ribityllumazine synthase [Paucibacter oligotrophus]|uniref:6,7-dimethyl-8-ribityllumazine synthase n=1 Tax=Roseateles oligotrophus TaxID=1769250 RepID=A0A840L4P5_9BURK|nr:6,7-dimethyl-8-ribityllumazine synthase [Roseateles oligotrophus]MBB4842956.1 6,7-dimethyl-8-ribityllumazine synthase [Roseateles oligotrophus]